MKVALASLAFTMAASGVSASEFAPVRDQSEFLGYLSGKNLTNRLYGLTLTVSLDGSISGRAAGYDVTGSWSWQDGYFCREMDWGGREIPYNCQLVEIRNGDEMRFTVDRGVGDSASFKLR